MSKGARQDRIRRRDEDLRRLGRLTVAAGMLGAGLFGAATLAAASNQPGRAIPAPGASAQTADSSQLQPAQAFQQPFSRRGFRSVAVSGGS